VSVEKRALPRWRIWVERGAWALLAAAIYFGVRFYQQRTLIEGPAPALQATLLDGQAMDLTGLRSQPVLVYFWATWCPVCRLEQGSIESVANDYRVVAVAMQSGSPAEVASYVHEHRLRVPVINDPGGAISAAWGVRATPTSFIIDRHGQIRFREVGYTSEIGLRLRLWWAGQ
jgi:peroxiredoxin